jgi:hypothetical protein
MDGGPKREDTKKKSLLGQDLMKGLTDGRERTRILLWTRDW